MADESHDITFGEFSQLYIVRYARPRLKRPRELEEEIRRHFALWMAVPLHAIKRSAIQAWVDDLAANKGKALANRCHDDMRAMLNWAIRMDYLTGSNPAKNIDRYKLKARDRFVQPGPEFEQLAAAIEAEPDKTFRDFFWLCLFTGARRTNLQNMRWEDIDFTLEIWKIPITKNGDSHTVSLTAQALAILQERHQTISNEWVFPSPVLSGRPIGNPKAAWRRILKRAGIKNLRIHDLRRTLASFMAIQGASQFVIGKTLGHKSVSATAIYARLTQAPVKEAMQQATQLMPKPQ